MTQTKPVVIDSQSVFDWLVFRHPACERWAEALTSGEWKWIFTSEMKAEFDAVARKGFGARWPVPQAEVDGAWSRWAHLVPDPAPLGASQRLVCTDRDDQKFIDLALATPAHTLVSRDKALLRLARKAGTRFGVQVVPPTAWPPPRSL